MDVIFKKNIQKFSPYLRSPRPLLYHLTTIWLFTFSDLKTIVGPKTVFGVVSALSGSAMMSSLPASTLDIVQRVPLVSLWIWLNLLPFNMDNQRQESAIEEDALNKPWRPLPSKRITSAQTTILMWTLYPIAFLASILLGGAKQCVALMFFGYWYNDLRGADFSCITRNLINAFGFLSFASGAMEVALGASRLPLNAAGYQWLLIIGAVVFSTVQMQDIPDQAGDSLRGRWTLPLVIGDVPARWSVAVLVAFWSVAAPWFWQLGLGAYVFPVVLAAVVSWRLWAKREVKSDKRTFRVWNLWMAYLYYLPLIKSFTT